MKKNKRLTYTGFGILTVFLLIAFDQFTKDLAIRYLKDQPSLELIKGVFELQYLENRGVAFGMLQGQRSWILFTGFLILAVLCYLYYKIPPKKHYIPLHILCAFMTAGAIGNIIDRFFRGFVVDFFYFSLIDFAIFNVADIYITVSAVVLIFVIIFYYKDEDFQFLSRKSKNKTGAEHGKY